MTPYSETVSKKWHKIIDEFNKSGLTPVEFSKSRTFNINTFYTWRKRINISSCTDNNKDNFLELKLKAPPIKTFSAPKSSSNIDIFLNNKVRISISDGFNESLLLKTIKVLNKTIC